MENFNIHVKTLQSKELSSSGKANSVQPSLNSFIFVEAEGLLLCSQQLANCLFP
jgi:hypothetical protein